MFDAPREIDSSLMGRTTKPRENVKVSVDLKWENGIAVLGIFLIQFALLPSHLNGHLPHWSIPAMVFLGVCCYMYKAIIDKDWVYKFSNAVGMVMNGSMLIRIYLA
jgi:hypothetical protein